MKYIRTKDGRILKFDDKICEPLPRVIGEPIDDNVGIFKGVEVVKQADTIEELIDEFVLIGICGIPYDSKQVLDEEDKHKKDFLIELVKSQDYEIYGAIWVGADLHSVAKMNDKGELELL